MLYFNAIAVGHTRMSSKIFIQVDFSGSKLKALQAKVNLKNDTYEKQPKRAHLLYNGHMLMTFRIGNWSLSILLYVYTGWTQKAAVVLFHG